MTVAKTKKSPIEQKSKLVKDLEILKKRIADFDQQRSAKVANLARRFGLTDLSDEVLEKEFKAIQAQHKTANDPKGAHKDKAKKKS